MQQAQQKAPSGLIVTMAHKYGVDPAKLLETLKATAFRQKEGVNISNEQMMALLVVANQYNLNPFTKEIYAFPDKNNGIVPVVGVDGWARIINEHPQFDGVEFIEAKESVKQDDDAMSCPAWIGCIIHRKDRSHPTIVKEYIEECYRPAFKGEKNGRTYTTRGHWQTHTKRALRHKALIQCARIAFAFVGLYDEDEANRIMDSHAIESAANKATESKAASVNNLLERKPSQPLDFPVQQQAAPVAAAPGFEDAVMAVSRGDIEAARDLMPNMTEGERAQIEVAIKNHEAAKQ